MRALAAALRAAGWALLGVLALAGLAISAVAFVAASPWGRPLVADAVIRIVDRALAGHFELAGIAVLPNGGVDVRGLRVLDPDGHLVLEVDHARVFADVTGLRHGRFGVSVELAGPAVMIEEEEGGGISLARAFAPASPAPQRSAPAREESGGPGITIEITRLAVRDGAIWWVDAAGATRLEARDVTIDARGALGPGVAEATLALRGTLDLPIAAPLAIDVVASRAGAAVRLPVLRVTAGGTTLAALGEGDLATRKGRLAITRLDVARAEVRALVPPTGAGADLAGTVYAESDGRVATAALRVSPVAGGERGGEGRADAAAAIRLDGVRALGFDAALDRLDPSRLHAAAPAGRVTLRTRGSAAGASLDALRGHVTLSLARSTLRGGEVGPAEAVARADGGAFTVERLSLRAPGVAVDGAGRFRPGGEAAGQATIDAPDLARAAQNLGRLLGTRLPALAGRARVAATLSGTARAPALRATVDAPVLALGDLAAQGVRLRADLTGPLPTPAGAVEGSVVALRSGGGEVLRSAAFRARIEGEEGTVSLTAEAPRLGREPVALEGRGRLTPRRDALVLSALALGQAGTRYVLEAPATIRFAGPAVDRLALAAGPRRIVFEGGLGAKGALDAHVAVTAIDLARIPPDLLPPGAALAGVLSAEARATGTVRRPRVEASFALERGAYRTLRGLDVQGRAGWDGAARRATVAVAARAADGSLVDAEADLPVPLLGRPGQKVQARVRARALPVGSLLVAAGVAVPIDGTAAVDVSVEGTEGAPALHAELRVDDGAYDDLYPLQVAVALDDPGERLALRVEAALDGHPALTLDAAAPLDLSELLARPAATAAGLGTVPIEVTATVPDVDLTQLAGALGLPQDLAGRVTGRARLEGSARAPRGTVAVALTGAGVRGYRDLDARVDLALEAPRIAAQVRLGAAGVELVRAEATLAAPPERLLGAGAAARLRGTAVTVDAVVPRVDLARVAIAGLPLSGVVDGKLTVRGSPDAPVAELAADGSDVAIQGRPLGALAVRARYAEARTRADASVRAAAGGIVTVAGTLDAPFGLGARGGPLQDAPVEAQLTAKDLDLAVLAALAPALVRTAGGKLTADVKARGPLARPRPRGTVSVKEGHVALGEFGEWTGIAMDAEVNDDAVELRTLNVRRGGGTFRASGFARGLAEPSARVEWHAKADRLSIPYAGQDAANVDLVADANGTYTAEKLDLQVKISSATVRLPSRTPRALQTISGRPDIVVGKQPERKRPRAPRQEGPPERPFQLVVHTVAPGPFIIKSENPKLNLELKADVTYELAGGADYASGSIEVVRGMVEPIGGRTFDVTRAKVQFTGGPPQAAMLDVEAKYVNPAATVTVTVAGALKKPEIRLTSQPPMDESQIALLIATGRAELKGGATGGVDTSASGEEIGKAALGALATQAFKNLVADKLPVDTIALDASTLRAGKYVTDNLYVGYVYRFDARPDRGENENEVRVEYQITPRWTFESRYGTAQSGSASVIWSRDY